MGYESPIFSSENITKTIHHLLLHLRNRFYRFTKDTNLMDGRVNLVIFEKRLNDQVKLFLNPLAGIVSVENKHDLSNKSKLPLSKSYFEFITNSLNVSEEIQDEKDQGHKCNSNSIANNSNKTAESVGFNYWLCGNNHILWKISKPVSDRKQFIKEHRLCWNCTSKKHTLKYIKRDFEIIPGSSRLKDLQVKVFALKRLMQ